MSLIFVKVGVRLFASCGVGEGGVGGVGGVGGGGGGVGGGGGGGGGGVGGGTTDMFFFCSRNFYH